MVIVKKAKVLVEYEDFVAISKKVDDIEESAKVFSLKTATALELMQEEIKMLAGNKTPENISPGSPDSDIVAAIDDRIHPIMVKIGAGRYRIVLEWVEKEGDPMTHT